MLLILLRENCVEIGERKAVLLNPFETRAIASQYEDWYAGPGKRADRLEKNLLKKMLAVFPRANSILDIGCGTGHFSRWLVTQGFEVVALDAAASMLQVACSAQGIAYIQGDAHALPFRDQEFDLAAMVTTLEFLQQPGTALAEAARVARQGLVIGVLNRFSALAIRRRISPSAIWRAAHFYSVRQLVRLAQHAAGERVRAIRWRTTLWPILGVEDLPLPWGGFIGLTVELN
jgi:ubiquinone/menaquinone biosynthesis C-methylase UbiE